MIKALVKTWDELQMILAPLGDTEGMEFLPEMQKLCGREIDVYNTKTYYQCSKFRWHPTWLNIHPQGESLICPVQNIKIGDRIVFCGIAGEVVRALPKSFWVMFPEGEFEFLHDGRRHEWQHGPVCYKTERAA